MNKLKRRFIIFSLVQGLVICLCIVLSVEHFGRTSWERKPAVGLILASTADAPGWPQEISQGMRVACKELGYELYLVDGVSTEGGQLEKVTEGLVKKGARHIFLANPGYQRQLETIARRYPEVSFYANSVGEHVSRQMMSYSLRYYEARYLAGVLAGLHTKSGVVGYVAPFPAAATRRDLNAFALGVQSVRKDARVLVRWTGQWISAEKEHQAIYRMKLEGADIVTYFLASQNAAREAERLGIDYIDFHRPPLRWPSRCLAAIDADWAQVCRHLLQLNIRTEKSRVYWPGLLDGAVELRLGRELTPREKTLVIRERQRLQEGSPVFSGLILDQQGTVRCSPGEAIDSDALREHMDWLVKGVEVVESR